MPDVFAMVQTGVRTLEPQRFPRPTVGPDDALLRLQACGICGSDYEQYAGEFAARYPVIPGHEPVGVIDEIGDTAAQRWGVTVGDLVVVEPGFNCGRCHGCLRGRRCVTAPGSYGYTPTDVPPHLWGGYADYLYLAPGSIVHRIDPAVGPRLAALYNPLGAGFAWAQAAPNLSVGQSIAILGAGQRGLAAVVAAHAAGAAPIIVTGLSRDEHKLALARDFGAHLSVNVDSHDPVAAVKDATDGLGADVVLDTTPYATDPVVDALEMARRGGAVVLAGLKGSHHVPDFASDRIIMKMLTVRGVLGVDSDSFRKAIRLIESRSVPLERMITHTLPIAEAERAIQILAGDTGEAAINVALVPDA